MQKMMFSLKIRGFPLLYGPQILKTANRKTAYNEGQLYSNVTEIKRGK
jgi:hypothetical protein